MIRNMDKRHTGGVSTAADGTATAAEIFDSCRAWDSLFLMRCSPLCLTGAFTRGLNHRKYAT
jgi:hypothetical protein